jgi:hypothetical protein
MDHRHHRKIYRRKKFGNTIRINGSSKIAAITWEGKEL